MVEPYKLNVEISRAHRSRKTTHIQAAIVAKEELETPTVKLLYSNLMTTMSEPSEGVSDPHGHAQSGRRFLPKGESIHEFEVRAMSLRSALLEGGAPSEIDFLSIDIEGMDFEIIESFDFDEYRIRYVMVEAWSIEKFETMMTRKGFVLAAKLPVDNYLFENKFSSQG